MKLTANQRDIFARPMPARRILLSMALGLLLILSMAGCSQQSANSPSTGTGSHPSHPSNQPTSNPSPPPDLSTIHVPTGFHINVFATELAQPRFIAFSPDGTLFATERQSGQIVALLDPDHTGKATEKKVVVSGLNDPTTLQFYQGKLYVGERTQISSFTLDASLRVTGKQVVVPNLPESGQHNTRTVFIDPKGNLYVAMGASCNVCIETDPHRAAIWVYHLDGSGGRLYAKGLRNAVGVALNPWNQQIWVTNNGRDMLGDNTPPETVYGLQNGGNYGWPTCHAGTIIDPQFGHSGSCNGVIAPLVKMQAHSAPLALAFYNGTGFPSQYRGVFIAFHGSWNRSVRTGYKVVFVPLDAHGNVAGPAQDFATGWLTNNNQTVTGRPVGLAVGPDGKTLYVSDDQSGAVYRIEYRG